MNSKNQPDFDPTAKGPSAEQIAAYEAFERTVGMDLQKVKDKAAGWPTEEELAKMLSEGETKGSATLFLGTESKIFDGALDFSFDLTDLEAIPQVTGLAIVDKRLPGPLYQDMWSRITPEDGSTPYWSYRDNRATNEHANGAIANAHFEEGLETTLDGEVYDPEAATAIYGAVKRAMDVSKDFYAGQSLEEEMGFNDPYASVASMDMAMQAKEIFDVIYVD